MSARSEEVGPSELLKAMVVSRIKAHKAYKIMMHVPGVPDDPGILLNVDSFALLAIFPGDLILAATERVVPCKRLRRYCWYVWPHST